MLTLTRKAPLVISRLETKNVNLSEEWTGTMRFQILRTRHLGGYKWVERRPTLVEESFRRQDVWPEAWAKCSKNQEREIAEWPEVNAKLQSAGINRDLKPLTIIASR